MAGTEKDFKVKKGLIVSEGITLGGHTFNDIDIGTEHVDTDDHIMSSGAIKEYVDANGGIASLAADSTPQLGGDLDTNGSEIVSTSNQHITITPDGTGDVQLNADNIRVGDSNADVTITPNISSTTAKLQFQADGDVLLRTASGTGDMYLNANTLMSMQASTFRFGTNGGNPTITTLGTSDLTLNTNSGTNSGSIVIADGANSDISITPNGTGQVNLGNFQFDVDQTVGSGQDNYVLTYDHANTQISLEAAAGGSPGGSDTFIQYNNGGSFGATTLSYDDTADAEQYKIDVSSSVAPFVIVQTGTGNAFEVHDDTDPDNNRFEIDQYGRVAVQGQAGTNSAALYAGGIIASASRIRSAAGSASNLAFSTTGDTNTGMYFPAADNLGFSTGGTERFRFGSNGEILIGGTAAGSNGQVLTSGGSGSAVSWTTVSGGGASAIDDLSDAITTATSNIGLGSGALDSLTASSGNYNVALGVNAGTAITTGDRNLAIGYGAADAFDTESDNIAIGYDALGGSVAGGDKNVMIGNYAGDSLTSGTENVGIGYQAHTGGTGFFNVAVGSQAGKLMTSNSYQTLVGYQAGQKFNGTNARFNTAIGYQAMGGGTSSPHQNTALGAAALYNVNGVSRNNIGIGYQSGVNQTSGSGNIIIGSGIDLPSTSGSRQLKIAGNDGSTTTTWIEGNSDGIVLGALTPLFFERAALNSTTVDMRVPTVQSSTANPNAYPMPFAGKVMAVSFLFAGGSITSNSNANTWRLRTNGAASGTDFSWSSDSLTETNTNNYTKVVTGSDVAMTFNAGDILQFKRTASGTSLNNAQAIVWVKYNL